MIPDFKDDVLPVGDHETTFDELRKSILVTGCGNMNGRNWDAEWRLQLLNHLETMVAQLWEVGITNIYIDGSFAEDKDHPNDIDGYFDCDLEFLASGDLQSKLNLLEPDKIWTWAPETRRAYLGYPKKQLPMWHKYRVELWPHAGQISGIRDKFGNDMEFPAAFRISRNNDRPKGIVKIVK